MLALLSCKFYYFWTVDLIFFLFNKLLIWIITVVSCRRMSLIPRCLEFMYIWAQIRPSHHVFGGICNDLFHRRVCLLRNAPQEPRHYARAYMTPKFHEDSNIYCLACRIEFFIPILRTSCCVFIRNFDFFQEKCGPHIHFENALHMTVYEDHRHRDGLLHHI